MRAAVMYGAGDVRVEKRPDPRIINPTDAVMRVTYACICGSDLWPYTLMPSGDAPRPVGHEALGVVEDVGADVWILSAQFIVRAFQQIRDNAA